MGRSTVEPDSCRVEAASADQRLVMSTPPKEAGVYSGVEARAQRQVDPPRDRAGCQRSTVDDLWTGCMQQLCARWT